MSTTMIHCLHNHFKVGRICVFALILCLAFLALWPVLPVQAQELSTTPLSNLWSTAVRSMH